jgi:hypothetical protein
VQTVTFCRAGLLLAFKEGIYAVHLFAKLHISPAFDDALSTDNVILSFEVKGKSKGKVHPRTGHEGPEGE